MVKHDRSHTVDSAHSAGSEVRPGERAWDDLDGIHSSMPSPVQPKPGIVMEKFPTDVVNKFHEAAARQWVMAIAVSGTLVFLFTYLRLSAGFSVLFVALAAFVARRQVEDLKNDFVWDVERQRSDAKFSPVEQVEWLNHALSAVWPILDQDLFLAGIDLLEDALKALSPSIVRTARISSFEQGVHPLRLLSFKLLPDDFDITEPTGVRRKSQTSDHVSGREEEGGDDPGTYVNLEVEFAYRRLPPPHPKESNMHFLLHLGIGVKGFRFELPVWVGVQGLHGRLRLRLQMVPDPPFVRHVKFSFPELPATEIAAHPLKSFNLMTLPGFSPLILSSLNSVLENFRAPRSYTIDSSRFFLGSDVQMRTSSIGVVCLVIHSAAGLPESGSGSSNPFINISFGQAGRVLLRLSVIDFEQAAKDIAVGYVDVPLGDLRMSPGTFCRRREPLRSSLRSVQAEGDLSYSAAFFGLATIVPPLQPSDPDGTPPPQPAAGRPPAHKSGKTFVDRTHVEDSRSGEYAQRMREMLDGRHPANPNQPSGILSFQIHQVANLHPPTIPKTKDGRKKESDTLATTFCNVFLNDFKVLRTRSKPLTSTPYFNASGEALVADWTKARLDVVILDARASDHSTVMCSTSLDLKTLLKERSQVTKWFKLDRGPAGGSVRISLLYKPIDIDLPPSLRSWGVGRLDIISASAHDVGLSCTGKITVTTSESPAEFSTPDASTQGSTKAIKWNIQHSIQVPVIDFQTCSLTMAFDDVSGSTVVEVAISEIWLRDFGFSGNADGVEVEVPLYKLGSIFPHAKSPPLPSLAPKSKYRKSVTISNTASTPSKSQPTSSLKKMEGNESGTSFRTSLSTAGAGMPVAVVVLKVRWIPGLSRAHRDLVLRLDDEDPTSLLANNFGGPLGLQEAYQAFLSRAEDLGGEQPPIPASGPNETAGQIARSLPTSTHSSSRRESFVDGTSSLNDVWVEDESGSEDDQELREISQGGEGKRRGSKTFKWVSNGVKVGMNATS
ncbi:hypothetical protein T439DRAFT_358908 [Meredithblackwellia eburnea MCA 4105]